MKFTNMMHKLLLVFCYVFSTVLHGGEDATRALNEIVHRCCADAASKREISPMRCMKLTTCPDTHADLRTHLFSNLLCWAVREGDWHAVDYLCEQDPACANATNCWRETPLFIAAHRGEDDMVITLLRAGADPNAPSGDFYSFSSIFRHPRALFYNVRSDIHEDRFRTTKICYPLHIAAYRGHTTTVFNLLNHQADPRICCTHGGPLTQSVQGLLERNRLSKGTKACERQCLDVIQLLVRYGADINEKDGEYPLFYRCACNFFVKITRFLLSGNTLDVPRWMFPDIFQKYYEYLHHPEKFTNPAEYQREARALCAVFERHTFCQNVLTETTYNLLRNLSFYPTNPKFVAFFAYYLKLHGSLGNGLCNGKSLLIKAIKQKKPWLVEAVLEWGVDPNVPNVPQQKEKELEYPLDAVSYYESDVRDKVYKILMWHGARLWTPSENKEDETIKCLLQQVADCIAQKRPFLTFLAAIKKDDMCAHRKTLRKATCIHPELPAVPDLPHEIITKIWEHWKS